MRVGILLAALGFFGALAAFSNGNQFGYLVNSELAQIEHPWTDNTHCHY